MKFEVECKRQFFSKGTAMIYLLQKLSGERKKEFAGMLGVDQATLTRWQNGSFFPQEEVARRIHERTGGIITPDMWYQRVGALNLEVEIKEC